jgi:hypothetical protein
MRTFLPNSLRRVSRRTLLLALAPALIQGCTDLAETPKDALTPDNAFKTEAEITAGVASVYASLRGMMWGYWNLSEITTDELLVPTRGNDWYDNGRWLEIHRQGWAPNSGSALDDMNGMWNDLFAGIAKANLMIKIVGEAEGLQQATKDVTLAELRTLRAWYYYMLQDMFGGVPLAETPELAQRDRASRTDIFSFIETELNEVRANLPPTREAAQYGRITQAAADAILASLYLNAGVFNKNSGISATSYNSCTVAVTGGQTGCAAAIAAADRVINSGRYSLAPDWKRNFSIDNEGSPENIFVLVHTATAGLGMSLQMRPLHYNQLVPAPWNGFAAIAETYRAFDPNDERRNIFLVGQQYSYNNPTQAVNDRNGNPLVFSVDIANIESASEAEGPRLMKYPPLPGAPGGDAHPNDFAFFRLAEMYLIKAEALNEQGDQTGALTIVNMIRARHIPGAVPLAGLNQAQVRAAILNERLFELTGEAKRRQDLIRHGRFTEARRDCASNIPACTKPARGDHVILMPIPQTQIQNNPKLTQNPGYGS